MHSVSFIIIMKSTKEGLKHEKGLKQKGGLPYPKLGNLLTVSTKINIPYY